MNRYPSNASRREFLLICAAVGVVSSFFAGALCALAATKREQRITGETIDEAAAFATVRELGALMQRKKISAADLTEMYLARLKRFNPQLNFLITLTEERARAQASELDVELGKGRYRGPLHGIPWGAKDLLAVRGYPTTWGAGG